jgi:hypothetical protein
MRSQLLFLCAGLVVAALGSPNGGGLPKLNPRLNTNVPTLAQVQGAFQMDGFNTTAWHTLPSGAFAVRAASNSVVGRINGLPKLAYMAYGNHSEIGWLIGFLGGEDADKMAVTYIDHFLPALLAPELDQELTNSSDPEVRTAWDDLCSAIGAAVVHLVRRSFWDDGNSALIPLELVQEMQGVVAGAQAAGYPNVTLDRIVTLNYGMDWLSAVAYAGNLSALVQAEVGRLWQAGDPRVSRSAWKASLLLQRDHMRVPVECDALAASGPASGGSGSVFARDFQLPAADAFAQANAPMILVPRGSQELSIVGAGAPGMVGMITAVNEAGFSMGVDTLRTGDVDTFLPGHASILLVRATTQMAPDVPSAIDYVVSRRRGLSWLYPMSDAEGRGTILETGKWRNDTPSTPPDLSLEVADLAVRELQPPFSDLQRVSPAPYAGAGVYVRNASYRPPMDFLSEYNRAFFDWADQPFPTSPDAFGPNGLLFPNFTFEDQSWWRIASRYYSPGREPASGPASDHVVVTSNVALIPQLRAVEMTEFASLLPGHSPQWRFDMLSMLTNALAQQGEVDFEAAARLVQYLQPCPTVMPQGWTDLMHVASGSVPPLTAARGTMCTPGFWDNLIDPQDPTSAIIEGSLTVADLKSLQVRVKAGVWSDGWLQLSMRNYL